MTRRNSFRITVSAAGLLMTFLACSSYAAKSSRSVGGDTPITVVIDAGHGGHDRGGIPGQRIAEKDMTLDVALRLRNILSANGYNVVMTRSTDVFVPLGGRVAIANSYRNAIFVCIHFNATGRRGASGIETYFYSRESLPLASESDRFEELFFFRALFLCERFELVFLDEVTFVLSMYGCNGMLSAVATLVLPKPLPTELRPRIPAAISSASF